MGISFASAILGFLLLARCGIGFTNVADVMARPEFYQGKDVLIRGTVKNTLKIPFVTIRGYSVADKTGEIAVSTSTQPPLAGAEVHVRGRLETLAQIGEQNYGLYLREIERW